MSEHEEVNEHEEEVSPLRQPAKKKVKKKAKAAKAAKDEEHDEKGDADDNVVPFAPKGSEQQPSVMVSRKLPPPGYRGTCDTGFAGYIQSDDLRVILDQVEARWKGGVYKLDFFKGGRPTGETREVEVPGEPLPLREDDEQYDPAPPIYPSVPPYPLPPAPPAYGYPPMHGYPSGDRWRPPASNAEDELREEVERLRKEREEEERRRERKELEERMEKRFAALQRDPMDGFMQLMRAQLEADQRRYERERAEERERREREERAREAREREERERRDQERREREARDREERERRDQERKEREAREERLAAEQRSFMQAMAKQNSPETIVALLSTLKTLAGPSSDPMEQVTRLLEVTQMVKETAGVAPSEDDGPQGLLGGLGRLAKGVGDYLESKSQEPPAAPAAVQPQQLDGGAPAPAPARPRVSTEQRIGRFVQLLKLANDAYKSEQSPEDTAKLILGYAKSLMDQGHEGVLDDVRELAHVAGMPPAQIVSMLTVLKTQITNQRQALAVDELAKAVNTPEGAAWVKATLEAVGEEL